MLVGLAACLEEKNGQAAIIGDGGAPRGRRSALRSLEEKRGAPDQSPTGSLAEVISAGPSPNSALLRRRRRGRK